MAIYRTKTITVVRFSFFLLPPSLPQEFIAGSSAVRRRGAAGGAGELETVGGGVAADGIDKMSAEAAEAAQPSSKSTFWRLWSEAKHEKGHLGMAGVCLLISSSANLMAPAIMAK